MPRSLDGKGARKTTDRTVVNGLKSQLMVNRGHKSGPSPIFLPNCRQILILLL